MRVASGFGVRGLARYAIQCTLGDDRRYKMLTCYSNLYHHADENDECAESDSLFTWPKTVARQGAHLGI